MQDDWSGNKRTRIQVPSIQRTSIKESLKMFRNLDSSSHYVETLRRKKWKSLF